MSSFSEVFGGGTIYPSSSTYLSLVMTADETLQWPIEQQIGGNVAAAIIDVSASPGLNINLSDARQVSTGYTSLFNNVGGNTVTVRDSIGGTIISLVSGTVWEIYLVDNSTAAGTWRVFQFGASVSTAVAAALAGAGLKAIGVTLNEKMVISSKASNYVIVDSDRANTVMWTSGAGAFTLPDPAVVGSDWFCSVRNSGSGDLTVTPPSGLIDGAASKTYSAGTSSFILTDGTNFYTLGFGSGGTSSVGFDHTSVNIAGTGTYTLSGSELNRISYYLTGLLTGNKVVVVPTAIQEYWITNNTTGAFSVTIKTAAGTGIIVTQGSAAILQCDGTNVTIGQSTGTTFPITVGQGGTNATTAAGARTNLGVTATGDAVFTAASAAAALSALSGVPQSRTITAGTGLTGGGDLSADRTIALTTPVAVANGGTGSAAPAIVAGSGISVSGSFPNQTVTNTSLGFASFVTKAADTIRSANTSLTNDPDLILALATGTYWVEFCINWTMDGSFGFKCVPAFSGTVDTTHSALAFRTGGGSLSTGGMGGNGVNVNGTAISQTGSPTVSGGAVLKMEGILTVTVTGNLSLQWAQQSSGVFNTTVYKGSSIRVMKVI